MTASPRPGLDSLTQGSRGGNVGNRTNVKEGGPHPDAAAVSLGLFSLLPPSFPPFHSSFCPSILLKKSISKRINRMIKRPFYFYFIKIGKRRIRNYCALVGFSSTGPGGYGRVPQ